ncbi:MAG: choice-of-anchor D domain-containing protein, partial [Clostridiales bacterium]|nr:choice-of-anchor D domain-containing protein [Clostridiales bacterium]
FIKIDSSPIFKLSFDVSGTLEFEGVDESTIAISNTGNAAAENLSIVLSGTNPDAFKLSKTWISGINAGETGTFTVMPNAGLAAGTYTATVTVTSLNVSASFDVSFTVKPQDANRPTVGDFKNHKDNIPKDFYKISKNAEGHQVISYGTNGDWYGIIADVSGYTPEYTRLCMTLAFDGTKELGIDAVIPGKKSWVTIRDAGLAFSKQSARNADGSYTFDIPLSKYTDIMSKGLSSMVFYIDPMNSFSGTRSVTVLDIGFRKDGEPAGPLGSTGEPKQGIKIVSATSDPESGTTSDRYSYIVSTSAPATKIEYRIGTDSTTYYLKANGSNNFDVGTASVNEDRTTWKWLGDNLPAGTHAVGVKAYDADGNTDAASFSITVVKANRYGVSVDPSGTYAFPDANAGYSPQAAKAVTVTNTGSSATGKLDVALSGTGKSSFTLSKTSVSSIGAGKTGTFTVTPKAGLAAGAHTATVTVSNSDVSAQFDVSFTVNPLNPPEIPVGSMGYFLKFDGNLNNENGAGPSVGSVVGSPPYVNGRDGSQAVSLSRRNYLELDSAGGLIDYNQSFTVAYWIKINSAVGSDPAIMSNKNWDSGGNNGWMFTAKGGTIKLNSKSRSDSGRVNGSSDIEITKYAVGQWVHVAAVWDKAANRVRTYANGVLVNDYATNLAKGMGGNSAPTLIGQSNDSSASNLYNTSSMNVDFALQDFFMTDRALTSEEVWAVFSGARQ